METSDSWNQEISKCALKAVQIVEIYLGFLVVLEVDEGKSSLNVVQNSELISGLWDGDDVHQTDWILEVSSGDSVNLNLVGLFLQDNLSFLSGQSVFKLLLENKGKWKTLSKSVWSLSWSGSLEKSTFLPQIGILT